MKMGKRGKKKNAFGKGKVKIVKKKEGKIMLKVLPGEEYEPKVISRSIPRNEICLKIPRT